MDIPLDCIPCFTRQVLEATRMATSNSVEQTRILRLALRQLAKIEWGCGAPRIGQQLHRLVRRETGSHDPYHQVKAEANRIMMELYPELLRQVEQAADPFATALRFSIAANTIDFAIHGRYTSEELRRLLFLALQTSFDSSRVETLRAWIRSSERILLIADNTGEIVADRLLLETLPNSKVALMVRGKPVLNDVTVEDLREIGIPAAIPWFDSGSDLPGVDPEELPTAARNYFMNADLILAKGQANYETLRDLPRRIAFLFKVKCSLVAGEVNQQVGTLLLHLHDGGRKKQQQTLERDSGSGVPLMERRI